MGLKEQVGLSAGLVPLLFLDGLAYYYMNFVLKPRMEYLPGDSMSQHDLSPVSAPVVEGQKDSGDEERMILGAYSHVLPQHHPEVDHSYQQPALDSTLSRMWVDVK